MLLIMVAVFAGLCVLAGILAVTTGGK